MSDTNPITKEELLTAITSALAVIRPEFDDPAYSAVIKFAKELEALGDKIGVVIRCQHEDIFKVMHRI